ncbi:MAG TPA: hypothetical protein VGC92_03265 [Phenylobacterium sp.]|jgi:hypothetical protein
MIILKVVSTTDGPVIALNSEAVDLLGGSQVAFVGLTRNDRGELTVRSLEPSYVESLELGREFIAQYDETFKALAKS